MSKDKSLGQDGKPKFFFSAEKAQAFIDKKKLGETHEWIQTDIGKYEILPKGAGHASKIA